MPPAATITSPDTQTSPTTFLWLDLTRACTLNCKHCYNHSGPAGDHGTMSLDDWLTVIDAAAALGVRTVQFIGGEPTLYPALPDLVDRALGLDLDVEVFTNLVYVTTRTWKIFGQPGVRIATSYYSSVPAEHEQVTGPRGSHTRTRGNIIKAIQLGVPLRVGLIDTGTADVDAARAELLSLGVTNIRVDKVRAFGRAAAGDATAGPCGNCGLGRAAVGPDGRITPCIMTDRDGGNVLDTPLAELLSGQRWRDAVGSVPRPRTAGDVCNPDSDTPPCGPTKPEPDPNAC
ncbi:radical SAM protein [Frankia sp. QA3]|uniref:radical SAM protein n=1 Tax=Frankia sp. QA3 TaxID=710111 RepID=UPI000269BCD6|nr:radical SAM protein [Frankia sp. QA3]EIV92259.1 radical SAM superfamily enzyme [Frankia sp. QA3]